MYSRNCCSAKSRSDFALPRVRAQGIAAESPQDLHWQIRGLGAESLVFFVRLRAKKMRQKYKDKNSCEFILNKEGK
jgi:hypothetical protein